MLPPNTIEIPIRLSRQRKIALNSLIMILAWSVRVALALTQLELSVWYAHPDTHTLIVGSSTSGRFTIRPRFGQRDANAGADPTG